MIRLTLLYLTLLLISSCCSEKKNRSELVNKLLNVTPVPYDILIDSIPTGIKLHFDKVDFDFPIKDTLSRITQTDTALTIKYGDTLKFFVVKEDYQWALKQLKKQAETREELKRLLEEKKFNSDLELLDYLYNSRPEDENPDIELLMDIKEILMPAGAEKGIYKIKSPILKGYQYCTENRCKTIVSDIYINGNAYKIIGIGFSQETFHKILGSMKFKSDNLTP